MSDPELVQILGAMLPDPVYPFGGFVPKIGRIEISAQKKHEDNVLAVGRFQVVDFDRFFLPSLIDVGEVTSGFRFDEYWQMGQFRFLGLDYRVDGNLDGLGFGLGGLHKDIEPEGKRARLHLIEWSGGRMRLQLVAALGEVFLDERELTLLLRVPDDGFCNSPHSRSATMVEER